MLLLPSRLPITEANVACTSPVVRHRLARLPIHALQPWGRGSLQDSTESTMGRPPPAVQRVMPARKSIHVTLSWGRDKAG